MAAKDSTRGTLSANELSAFCAQLALITKAGIPAQEGISIMMEDAGDVRTRELMQSVGASRFQSYRMMILPSAATDIITGLRLAAIFATTTCISVEYNAGNTGLGSQIIKYSQYLQTTQSFACIFYVTVIGLIMYGLITLIQKKIVNWEE